MGSLTEWIAVGCGLASVVLTIRRSLWCWPAGLLQVVLYCWVFYQVRLYSDLLLHVVYVGLIFYGWVAWFRNRRAEGVVRVGRLSAAGAAAVVLGIGVGSGLLGFGMRSWTDASLPYWDAFTTVASLFAQWLLARRRLESWMLWMGVDVVAIGIYAAKGLWPTTLLYGVFLVLAGIGLRSWTREYRARADDEGGDDAGEIRALPSGASAPD